MHGTIMQFLGLIMRGGGGKLAMQQVGTIHIIRSLIKELLSQNMHMVVFGF